MTEEYIENMGRYMSFLPYRHAGTLHIYTIDLLLGSCGVCVGCGGGGDILLKYILDCMFCILVMTQLFVVQATCKCYFCLIYCFYLIHNTQNSMLSLNLLFPLNQ